MQPLSWLVQVRKAPSGARLSIQLPEAVSATIEGMPWAPLAGPAAAQLYFSTANDGWLLALDGRLHQTRDGGASWEPLTRDAALRALANPQLKPRQFGQFLAMLLTAGGFYPT